MNLKNLLRNFLWVLILVFSGPSFAYEGLTVRIGYSQGLELYQQSSILKETLEYLQKKIPNYRFELLPISSVDTQEDIKKEKIDFLIAPSNFFVEISGGIPFTHLATRIFDGTKDPAKTVGSAFVVRADRKDIKSLTPREKEIFELAAGGKSNKEIASELDIAVATVKMHRANAFEKMSVHSSIEALHKLNAVKEKDR